MLAKSTSSTTIPAHTTNAAHATGRQRGDGSDLSGKTKASASGHRNNTGHGDATVAARQPERVVAIVLQRQRGHAVGRRTIATDAAPSSRITRDPVPGRRSATNKADQRGRDTLTTTSIANAMCTKSRSSGDAATALPTTAPIAATIATPATTIAITPDTRPILSTSAAP